MIDTPAIAQRSLPELEAVVDTGLHTFLEVGEALAEIRERRLYRETHESFEAYCSERYDLKRQRAYELMAAANVVARMSEISDTVPQRESHAAALAPLRDDPPSMVDALAEAEQDTGGHVTAAAVERAVKRRLPRPVVEVEPADVIEPEPVIIMAPAPEPQLVDPPADAAEAWLLIADLAAYIRDRVLTKLVVVDGITTRHDRHCTATAERLVCAAKCAEGRALVERAELTA